MVYNPLRRIPLKGDGDNLGFMTRGTERIPQALCMDFRAPTDERHLNSGKQNLHGLRLPPNDRIVLWPIKIFIKAFGDLETCLLHSIRFERMQVPDLQTTEPP